MSGSDKWLRIRNWDKWQTYRSDRGQPPWIKVHRCLMRNPDWVALTDAQRGQLVSMWLLAADRDGVIPASPELIQKLCFLDFAPDLQVFVSHGFIEDDDNVTSDRRQSDDSVTAQSALARGRGREEAEAETEREQSSALCATKLPDSWAPTASHIERAKESGVDVLREADKFRAHAVENDRKAKVWNAAFTRWLINAEEYASRSNGRGAAADDRRNRSTGGLPMRRL